MPIKTSRIYDSYIEAMRDAFAEAGHYFAAAVVEGNLLSLKERRMCHERYAAMAEAVGDTDQAEAIRKEIASAQ